MQILYKIVSWVLVLVKALPSRIRESWRQHVLVEDRIARLGIGCLWFVLNLETGKFFWLIRGKAYPGELSPRWSRLLISQKEELR